MTRTGENVGATPIFVRHTKLKRISDSSPFRSWCPVCDQGVLLVGRNLGETRLRRVDNCSLCGQVVIYEDDRIAGEELTPDLLEVLAMLARVQQELPKQPGRWRQLMEGLDNE